jgi:F0F1-type ATP synthase assembly protein I
MRHDLSKTSVKSQSQASTTTMIIFVDIVDTTWRMFVPIVGLLLLGRFIDSKSESEPLFMLIGVIAGVVIAGILIRKQISKSV